ncbi:SGNH/GDSL hydrolase family protein [Desulfovibrio sp. TomC]|uniref:SGNH/GDSL hydrolase family protein n=1 Tax=Desulfovibrio sp. TomC TaxID=1562888 RepID=UPI0005742AE3|nr:SGNH/GDSL hydrolase family protein [Desulfovibrio sp. TomC]KHK00875.1 hypothetical protein NY78_3763 [Desulfovibrio sp. TomC]
MPPSPSQPSPARTIRQFWLCVAISLLALVVAFGLAEIVFRLKNHIPLTWDTPGLYADDAALGWRVKPHYREEKQSRDCAGEPYPLAFSTMDHGFREYGDTRALKKLLILGDSFTLNRDVSDGQTYSAILGRRLGCTVFTYGSGGYGSLQEYGILAENLARIRPDAILFQLHTNDSINNDFALEKQSVINNNFHFRPYLADDDTTVIASPYAHWSQAVLDATGRLLGNRSHIISSIQHNLQLVLYAKYKDASVERAIESGQDLPDYAHSLAATRRVFAKVCQASGDTPVFAFVLGGGRIARDLTQALAATCVTVLPDVSDAAFAQRPDEPARLAADCGHLSAYGNARLADLLADRLQPYADKLFPGKSAASAAGPDAAANPSP